MATSLSPKVKYLTQPHRRSILTARQHQTKVSHKTPTTITFGSPLTSVSHHISIVFAPTSSSGTATQSSLLQVVYGVAIAAAVVATVVVVLTLIIRGKKNKN